MTFWKSWISTFTKSSTTEKLLSSAKNSSELSYAQSSSPLRILDFDIETRKIGFHSGGRFNPDGCEPIAVACSWVGEDRIEVRTLAESSSEELLDFFLKYYNRADMVTGHYIRRFDLPILNGAMLETGRFALREKLCQDTKTDLKKVGGLSASQENLSRYAKLQEQKYHMADADWRAIARLEPDALQKAARRVSDDVRQHKALRTALLPFLKPPKVWRP